MTTYGLSSEQIDAAMSGARNLPNILNIMTRPGESKPWYEYRSMFLLKVQFNVVSALKINMKMF
jgi:membrane-bound lytic murein transglycosylase B